MKTIGCVKLRLSCTALALGLGLSACSVLESDQVAYKSAAKAPPLEVPPDLTQLSKDNRYQIPGQVVTASGFNAAGAPGAASVQTAAPRVGDVRIERAGAQRWLVVDRNPDQLWEPIKDFWLENGFLLVMEQPKLGILETDWAENRAKIPQDFIRNALGKLFDSLYSTGERDKFRTRLEAHPGGGTEIYISHRGMVEVYGDKQKDTTVWQPRAADPELEAEFLRRLMVKLGVSETQAKAVVASGVAPSGAQVVQRDGQPVLELTDPFDRAWRRVGLALDRTNFTVQDRDRSQGVYFVRFVPTNANQTEPGFFSRIFGAAKADTKPTTYRIRIVSADTVTRVSVMLESGQPAPADEAERIVKVLAQDLK